MDSYEGHSNAVEELLRAWETADPDPVDVFEDELAARLGFTRHPE